MSALRIASRRAAVTTTTTIRQRQPFGSTASQGAAAAATGLLPAQQRHSSSTRTALKIPSQAAPKPRPPFEITPHCPSPTCSCTSMPPDLEIDHKTPLNGSMAPYTEQVLISTGKPDWKSRIEDEDDAHLLQGLKKLLGRGGRFADPFSNVLLTNSSFEATPSSASSVVGQSGDSDAAQTGSAYVLPSFTYIPSISTTDASLETLIKGFVLPSSLPSHHPLLNTASPTKPEDLPVRQPALQSAFPSARPVSELLVLICGHGGRDSRCGILGPLLVREFEQKLSEAGVSVLKSAPSLSASPHPPAAAAAAGKTGDRKLEARVGTISHIGGHKFAGNIIVYIPPSFSQSGSASNHALAGKGIWYGRVEPRHVEGIVKETILGGKVVGDLFRGGVGRGGEVLRI